MVATTSTVKSLFPDSAQTPASQAAPDALIFNQAVQCPAIEGDAPYARIPFVDIAQDAFNLTREGAQINESEPALSELAFRTGKIALLSRVTNEAASYSTATNMLADSAQLALTAKLDRAFLQGLPLPEGDTGENPLPGLLNWDGITTSATGITDSLDPLLDLLGTLGEHGAAPTGIIASPATWFKLLKLKDGDGLPLITRTVAEASKPTLFGIPVTLNTQMPADTLLVHDATQVYASASTATVAYDSGTYFSLDSTAVRITCRIGYGSAHPERFGVITLAAKTTGK